jgi:hypothetical protein
MPIQFPEHQVGAEFPATSDYSPAGAHHETVTAARKVWKEHLAKDDWEDLGSKDGVALAKKPNPEDPNGVPIVKGVTTVPNTTTDQVLGSIIPGGVRKFWDPRLDVGGVLHRIDPSSFQFYTVMKGQMFISARDFVGIQLTERTHEPNHEIAITQTSIPDEEHAPPQSGKVRAIVKFGGWLLEPTGADVKLTYITCVSLEGSIPLVAVRAVAAEIPMCTARVRDLFTKHGWAPILDVLAPGNTIPVAVDDELTDPPSGKWTATLKTLAPGTINIRYDSKHMFKDGANLNVKVKSGPEDAATVTDDGAGTLTVEVKEAGAFVEVALSPK